METRRPGGDAGGAEIAEAGKLGNLGVWRLGGLGEALEATYDTILGAYRLRFGNPGGLEAREPRGLGAGRRGGGEGGDPRQPPGRQ